MEYSSYSVDCSLGVMYITPCSYKTEFSMELYVLQDMIVLSFGLESRGAYTGSHQFGRGRVSGVTMIRSDI